jgi:hypothetical protein
MEKITDLAQTPATAQLSGRLKDIVLSSRELIREARRHISTSRALVARGIKLREELERTLQTRASCSIRV